MKRNVLLGVVIVLVLLGVGGCIAAGDWVTDEQYVGYQGEARQDDLLAARLFLDEMGVPSEGAVRLGDLPPGDHLLLMRAFGHGLGRERGRRLRGWVEDGGHLVLLLPPPPTRGLFGDDDRVARPAPSPFLEELDVFVTVDDDAARDYEPEEDAATATADADADTAAEDEDDDDPTTRVRLREGEYDVELPSPYRIGLRDGDDDRWRGSWTEGPRDAHTLVRALLGEGRLTIVSDSDWVTNAELGDADNAPFMWELARWGGVPAGALLVRGDISPSLFAALVDFAPLFCLAGLLYVALWLWGRSAVFGPLRPEPGRDRRDFADHVAASGAFLWRHGAATELLASARRAAVDPWLRRVPGAASDDEVPEEAIAEATGLSVERVRQALAGNPRGDPAAMTRAVRDLARIQRTR